MKRSLVCITLITSSMVYASEIKSPTQPSLTNQIFTTRARLQILNDAALRIKHKQKEILKKQSELTPSYNAVITASQNLEDASYDLATKLQEKQKEIRATEAALAQLVQEEQATQQHRKNSWN